MKKCFLTFLICFFFLIWSCAVFDSSDTDDASSITSDSSFIENALPQKALLKLAFAETSSRTVLPNVQFSSFTLKGKLDTDINEVVLAQAETKTEMCSKTIEIMLGTWTFTMTAEIADMDAVVEGVTEFSDTQTVDIKSGVETISFYLTPFSKNGINIEKGSLNITIALAADTNTPGEAQAFLYKTGESTPVATKNFESLAENRSLNFAVTNLEEGTYSVNIDFFTTDGTNKIRQNSWQALARITSGLNSICSVKNFSLNEVYSINYENITTDDISDGTVLPTKYSRYSVVPVPACDRANEFFLGWYKTEDFSDTKLTESIPANTQVGDLKLYARFVKPLVYVKNGGLAANEGLTESTAVSSISEAAGVIDYLYSIKEQKYSYTIKICGEVLGLQTISDESFSSAKIQSIIIEGNTDNARDSLNGTGSTGSVLTINTEIPVTIKDLKLTGGSSTNGGGVNLVKGTLLLTDGAKITGNSAAEDGGGVYLSDADCVLKVSGTPFVNGNIKTGTTTASNVYLPDDKTITVTGALFKGTERAKIGVTTETAPVIGTSITFTSGYGYKTGGFNAGKVPGYYFTGDDSGICYDITSGEGILSVSGGTIETESLYGDISFTADKIKIKPSASNKTITFTAKETVGAQTNKITIGTGEDEINCTYKIFCLSEEVPETMYTVSGEKVTLGSSMPQETYIVYVTGIYKGSTYSTAFEIELKP